MSKGVFDMIVLGSCFCIAVIGLLSGSIVY